MAEFSVFVTHNYDGAPECGWNRMKLSKINMFPCLGIVAKGGGKWSGG